MFVSQIADGDKVVGLSTTTTFSIDDTQDVAQVEASQSEDGGAFEFKTDPGTTMYFTWRSMIFSSVIVADTTTGELMVEAPSELEVGEHTLYAYPVDNETGVRGETLMVNFSITDEGFANITAASHDDQVTEAQSSYVWLVVLVFLALGGVGIFARNARKQHKEEKNLIEKLRG